MEEKDRGIESFETGAWDTGKRAYCVCKINRRIIVAHLRFNQGAHVKIIAD